MNREEEGGREEEGKLRRWKKGDGRGRGREERRKGEEEWEEGRRGRGMRREMNKRIRKRKQDVVIDEF